MRTHYQFPFAVFPLALLVVGLLLAQGLSFWFLLLLTEILAIYVFVEVMTQRMPSGLLNASRDNCQRLDGSRSRRRTARENKALWKVRSDLWAIMLILASVATAELYAFHSYVFPMSLGADVAAALGDGSGDLKSALRQRNVDDRFYQWSRGTTRASKAEIRHRMQTLWIAWPVIVGLVLASAVAGVWLIRYAYLRVLKEFQQGIAARAQQYLNLDTARLQG